MLYCKPSKPTLTAALLLALITEHACKRENCYWNHEYRPRTVRSWFPHTDWLSLLQSYANSNKLNLIVNLCLWSFQSLVKDDSNINSLILSINSNNELNYLKTFECLKKKKEVQCMVNYYSNPLTTELSLWAVPRLFVHPQVEIIALFSMDSSYVFFE